MCETRLLVIGNLDYESKSSYNIVVRVTDQNRLFKSQQFTVQVVDVNDIPQVSKWFDLEEKRTFVKALPYM